MPDTNDNPAEWRAPLYERSSSGTSPERIAELRAQIEAKKAALAPVTHEQLRAMMKHIDMLEKTLFETRSALIDTIDHVIRLQSLISGKHA